MRNVICFILILFLLVSFSCRKSGKVTSTHVEFIVIDSTLNPIADVSYNRMLDSLDQILGAGLDSVIGYCKINATVYRPECELLNWVSDALLERGRSAFPGKVDVAIMNIGGLRCNIPQGDITIRQIQSLMPFNNELCIITLKGRYLLELCQVICMKGGQGISNMRIVGENNQLISATVGGAPIDNDSDYYIAVSDYLMEGMDGLTPLANHGDVWNTNVFLRDILLDAVRSQDTIRLIKDNRIVLRTL